jgi:hypothetical protein
MKKIFAILALVGVVAVGSAQNISKPGLYDKYGKVVVAEDEPVVVSVTLRTVTEHFEPGIYARYAPQYLGQRATLSESTSIELLDGRLALGEAEKVAPKVEPAPCTLPLPVNKMSAAALTAEEQAEATAKMIFSLRHHRLELITGETGENVFGAGLKAALDEIARIEKECLEMFYGKTTISEEIHTFNIVLTPEKMEYVVCRFNDETGVVAADDLSGKPVVLKIENISNSDYSEYLLPLGPKDKSSTTYFIVPNVKCSLVGETTLMDTLLFVSTLHAKSVVARPIK